jgi:hypothetical protein
MSQEQKEKLAENERIWEENARMESECDTQYILDNKHNLSS